MRRRLLGGIDQENNIKESNCYDQPLQTCFNLTVIDVAIIIKQKTQNKEYFCSYELLRTKIPDVYERYEARFNF